jgi:hypothetical protein
VPELRATVKIFETHARRRAKLEQFDAQLFASIKTPGTPQHFFVSPTELRTTKNERECYQAIEKLVQEVSERRFDEERAKVEELSRRITPEDVRLLDGFALTLTHLILSGRPTTPREQALILRLIRRTGNALTASRFWEKWETIAEGDSEEAVAEAARTVEEEMSRRGLDVSAVLNLGRYVDVESLEHCDPLEDEV